MSTKCLEEDSRLSEETLERLSERLVNRVENLNTYMIKKLGKQIVDIGTFTPSQVREVLQSVKYGNNLDEIMNKIADVSEKNVSDIYDMFEEVAKKNQNYAKQFYEYRKVKFIPYKQNKSLQEQVKAIAKVTANEYINMSKTFAYVKLNAQGVKEYTKISNIYQKITDEAILSIAQGRDSYEMAMRRAMKEMTSSGLRTVDFDSGYSRRADSSIRMNVMDGIRRLNQELQKSFGEEFGANGVEISHHKNAAPDHIDTIDGKQFSTKGDITINDTKYEDYDTVNNSLDRHVGELNCYHFPMQIVLGVSEPIYSKEQLEADKQANMKGFDFEGKHYTNYEGTQLQRQIETKIRQYKDRQIGAKAINDTDDVYHCQEKIEQLTNKYKELSDTSGLPTKIDRLRVDGYRKSSDENNKGYVEDKLIKSQKNVENKNKWFDNLTYQEQRNLKEYISSGSYKINEALYNNRELTEEQIQFIDSLDSALSKAPKYQGNVNRSVKIDSQEQLDKILSIFDNDDRIGSWGSYISSSKGVYDESMKLQFIIKSKNGRDLSSLNDEGGGEILFGRQTKFKYIELKKKNGKIYISLEEVE